ncbi:MAG TPA: ATP-binding protein [Intrasporangium sp.]|uniref:ATP-binding protein n=1 Tax=Intrasporangium sp. TaxID=1925024 RepID=UPI002D7951AF|nr:ATP-binding protein [Intrasporangium sp.]HET7398539.1 ATP-binding protein [Intrasporangium sp.]
MCRVEHATPEAARELARIAFGGSDLHDLRAAVAAVASEHTPERVSDVVLAVHELAVNSIVHGAGTGVVHVLHTGEEIVFDVRDADGGGGAPVVRPPTLDALGGRGLWLAQHLTDALTIDRAGELTSVKLHLRLKAS